MANTTETVFVEFVLQGEDKIQGAQQTLERTGKIDKALSDQFSKTNAELQQRQRIIESSANSIQQTAGKATSSVRDVEKAVNNLLRDFASGMQEGVNDALKEMGTSVAEVKKRIQQLNQESPFQKLSRELTEARNRVLNITTEMERLRHTGGVDTEQFVKLGQLLITRTAELDRLQKTYDTVTDSVNGNKKANEENAESVTVLTSAQEALAKKLAELKQRLGDTAKATPFDKLSKSVNDARTKVLNISAALAQLKKTGGVDTEQFQKLNSQLATSQAELQKLTDEYNEVSAAAATTKESTDDVSGSQATLRQRLSEVTKQLQLMKLAGEEDTDQYKQLVIEAGNLKDTLGDVGQEINNAANNSQALNGLIGTAQAITGGFAVAEGAVGLFGAAGEELQETLVKVNSALAVLQGLQAINDALQKESAASVFLNTAVQKIYNVVVGESIGLMAAFRIALASTGVGLLIIGIIALVAALKKENTEIEDANRLLERNKNFIEADTAAIKRNTDEQIARAQAANQKESEIIKLRGHSLELQRKAIEEANKSLSTQRDGLDKTSEAYFKLNKQIEDNNEAIKDIDSDIIKEGIGLNKQLRTEQLQGIADGLQSQLDAAKKNTKQELELARQVVRAKAAIEINEAGDNIQKRVAIEAAAQKEIRALNLQFEQVKQQDRISQTERSLLSIQQRNRSVNERIQQDEIDAEKQLIREKARLDLLQEGLTQNQKDLIVEKAIADQVKLQKDFNRQSSEDSINDLISRNNAELSQVNISNSEKLRLNEENLIAAAQIEIDQNKGLTDKIKGIRAKLNEDLRALRLASLQKELEDELALTEARTGALRRASERTAADPRKELRVRLDAINQIAALDIAAVNKKDDANKESLRLNLISQKEYNLRYAQLTDEELKITEDAELKKRELQKQTFLARVQFAADTANQIVSLVAQFGEQADEEEQSRIDAQRRRVDELKEAGAITEKEAAARQKRIDAEENALKRKAAQRDKAVAIFQATVNTAVAVVKAFAEGGPFAGPVLAAIVGAIGAAQIALIASKPIPKFAKGKKNNYEGPGEIGEAGAELFQSNGELYLAKKRTLVWIGKQDKVYNPNETVAMLEKNNMQPYIVKDSDKEYKSIYNQTEIDYDKLGKVISSNLPQVGLNIDQDGFTVFMKYKNSFNNYLDNRRSYK